MSKKHVRIAGYWTSTVLIALIIGSGGLFSLIGVVGPNEAIVELGYPAYFAKMLGVAKVLGAITILMPRFHRLKEWAYAGIAFELIAASVSHATVGHPAGRVIFPLILLGIAAASWALQGAREKSSTWSVQSGSLAASSV